MAMLEGTARHVKERGTWELGSGRVKSRDIASILQTSLALDLLVANTMFPTLAQTPCDLPNQGREGPRLVTHKSGDSI